VYYNGAVPATGAYYFVNCLSRHIHPAADMVLIEFAVNGASIKDTEGIVRRIMKAHGGLNYDPLIVFVNFWNNWPGRNDTYALHPWRSLIDQDDNESHITVVATYYDCVCLSMRYAYIFEDLHNISGFSYEDYINGGNHPNERGHRMMADLVVNLLLRQSFARSSLTDTPLVPAVYSDWLPPPIVDDNRSEEAQQMCSFGKELVAALRTNDGWTFEDNAEKPGMWANSSTARMTLAVAVQPPAEALKVYHLQSWMADMGTASVECITSACSCSQTMLNGKGGSHSIMVPTDVPIRVSGGGECHLLFKGESGSFKLMGVALAQLAHNFEGADFAHEAAPAS
jgi:UDP-glucose:glycoprotein glucosyltransferase